MNHETRKTPEEDALDRAYEILSEFYPAFVIVTEKRRSSQSGVEGETKQTFQMSWYGGHYSAIGLLSCAKNSMMNGGLTKDDGQEDSE